MTQLFVLQKALHIEFLNSPLIVGYTESPLTTFVLVSLLRVILTHPSSLLLGQVGGIMESFKAALRQEMVLCLS